MDETETPPDPDGVPAQTAWLTLTAPDLIAAYRAAQVAPITEAQIAARIAKVHRAREDRRENEPGGNWFEQPPFTAFHAKAELRKELIKKPREALEADFWRRVRDGRITVSCLERSKPREDRFDLLAERAARIGWPNAEGSVRYDDTALDALLYRRAGRVPLAEAPFVYAPDAERSRFVNGWQPDAEEVSSQAKWARLTPYFPPGAEWGVKPDEADIEPIARYMCVVLGRYELADGWKRRLIGELQTGALVAHGFITGDAGAAIQPFGAHVWQDRPAEDWQNGPHLDWETGHATLNGQRVKLVDVQRPAAVPERAEALPPLPVPAKRESAASRAHRQAAIIADIQARAAASPERPDESRKEQFERLSVAFPGITHAEHEEARRGALAAYPAWKRAGRRAG